MIAHAVDPLPQTNRAESLVLAVSEVIAKSHASMPAQGLREQLQHLAEALNPGFAGTAVAALDKDGEPLAIGLRGFEISEDSTGLEPLSRLGRELNRLPNKRPWSSFETSVLRTRDGIVQVVPIRDSAGSIGMLFAVARASLPEDLAAGMQPLLRVRPLIAVAIRSFLQRNAWRRIEELRVLARDVVDRQPWAFRPLVKRLADIFAAGAATLLLHEHGELRLAASTDGSLANAEVAYKAGQGLSGQVFKTAKAIRIHDSMDREEIRRATGLDRPGPSFAEHDLAGAVTNQFLGVPVRFGKTAVGVLRLSRSRAMHRFTREDESALQFFADLLGAALAPSWDLRVYRSILETTTEAIAVSRRGSGSDHPVWHVIHANRGAKKLLKRNLREINGMDASELYEEGEFDRIRHLMRPALERARQDGHAEFGPMTTHFRRGDGRLVPVSISYRILVNQLVDPPTIYIVGIARDQSDAELQAAQHRRFLELLDAMRIAYFLSDTDGRTIESTPMDEEISGYSREEIQNQSRKVLYADLKDRHRLLGRVRKEGGQLSREVVPALRKSGEPFFAEMDVRVIRDAEGREKGIEGLYRDVTGRLQLQGFVNAKTDQVVSDDQLFRLLKRDAELHLDYTSSLSHQLLTPLNALIGTMRNFERGEISRELLARRLSYAISQARVCTLFVRNLSFLDKVLRGQPFERERISFRKLAQDTKSDFRHLLEERSLTLSIDGESLDRNLAVVGHRDMLRQILINMIDNAIKYSFPATTISIRGRIIKGRGAIDIVNQGLVIPDSEREEIFDRGHRSLAAKEAVPAGTGLGLWLVRKILDAHGASISCVPFTRDGQERTRFRIIFAGHDMA